MIEIVYLYFGYDGGIKSNIFQQFPNNEFIDFRLFDVGKRFVRRPFLWTINCNKKLRV